MIMTNFYDSVRSERQFKSLTGISNQAFKILLQAFNQALIDIKNENYSKNRTNRSRRPGGGRKGKLSTPENKLFFILFYLKTYPTFDVLGFIFDLNPSKAEENVKKLLPILKRAQSKLNVLPKRILNTADDLKDALETVSNNNNNHNLLETKAIPNEIANTEQQPKLIDTQNDMILVDVTERSHFRPQSNHKQKKYYSGKQKTHTIKNTIISDSERRIIFLGKTFSGSTHDYKMFKTEFSPSKPWFSNIKVGVDLGYQGIKNDYFDSQHIYIPNKKPRKSKNNPNPSLTKEQKQENKTIASKRIVVEHAIGGMKSFHILSTRFRNRAKNFADYFSSGWVMELKNII